MKDIFKKIFKTAKAERLEEKKKESIKESVLLYMKDNPLPQKPKLNFWALFMRPAYAATAVLSAFILGLGTISVQAQSALPGEALYTVKTEFNERIMRVMAFSEKARTELNLELAETRLKEAEQLVSKGQMTKEKQEKIKENFSSHAEEVVKKLEKLEQRDISERFDNSLKQHGKVLREIKEKRGGNGEVQKIIEKVDDFIERRKGKGDKQNRGKNEDN